MPQTFTKPELVFATISNPQHQQTTFTMRTEERNLIPFSSSSSKDNTDLGSDLSMPTKTSSGYDTRDVTTVATSTAASVTEEQNFIPSASSSDEEGEIHDSSSDEEGEIHESDDSVTKEQDFIPLASSSDEEGDFLDSDNDVPMPTSISSVAYRDDLARREGRSGLRTPPQMTDCPWNPVFALLAAQTPLDPPLWTVDYTLLLGLVCKPKTAPERASWDSVVDLA
jgi:hypothetical protein